MQVGYIQITTCALTRRKLIEKSALSGRLFDTIKTKDPATFGNSVSANGNRTAPEKCGVSWSAR